LIESDLAILFTAADSLDWRAIDPTIFGTLFERGLDPTNRSQLGAHYTDVATINKLIEPLITRPLKAEWQAAKAEIVDLLAKADSIKTASIKKQHRKTAANIYHSYLERLRNFRVLDAACGSGNFLYLALHALKDLEHIAQLDAELFGFGRQLTIETGTDNILGFEINEYAAELARITVWIGDIQWCQRNGRPIDKNPILSNLDGIQHRDALLNADGTETEWPAADVIIGNPPFLGDKMMRGELDDNYVTTLRNRYKGRVPGGADLVCYWFDKARQQIEQGKTKAAGLVSTNSIRGGSNRAVLDAIVQTMPIFEAWADEDWFDNGTAVRVSLVCFGQAGLDDVRFAGKSVELIHSDLTTGSGHENTDITKAKILPSNAGTSFIGTQKSWPFDIPGDIARQWLTQPNPNGKPNSQIVRPWANGMDITRRPSDTWVIDFGVSMSESDASLFELPFEQVKTHVKPMREKVNRQGHKKYWWRHGETRDGLRKATSALDRFIATSMVSKHRFFIWMPKIQIPENLCVVIARPDDTTFGIVHSRFHELWSLGLCTWLGKGNDPRYTPTTCFVTFPFPKGLTPADTKPNSDVEKQTVSFNEPIAAIITNPAQRPHAQAIAEAAFKLNQLRENWLNPPEWVDWVITPEEEKAGFPKRPVAKSGHETELKKRTLTNLYNAKPAWLINAHQTLDKAVAKAYGWDDYTPEMTDAEILQRLLKLNLAYSQS
jgi:type II restriction/modification system DNA methylase subunit YeeA